MGRHPQSPAAKGSQHHLQRMVNDAADPLGTLLRAQRVVAPDEAITWLSPLASDDYAEYRDDAFLERVGLHGGRLDAPLNDFWPSRGPQWDGLALTDRRRLLLVEGKSHRSELVTRCRASNLQSLEKIQWALNQTRAYCRGADAEDWRERHYQVANRLAHLYWLRQLNGIDAHLVFVYFANDPTIRRPLSAEAWQDEISRVSHNLGLTEHPMRAYIHDLVIDVQNLDIVS